MADCIQTGTYSAIPAASNDGQAYLPSDGSSLYRDSGAAWKAWGPVFPFTAPVLGDFAWINQGGAAADQTYGHVYLLAPASGANSLRILKKSAPSTPYAIEVALMVQWPRVSFMQAGFIWRQSSDGKLQTVIVESDAVTEFSIQTIKYSDPATGVAVYKSAKWENRSPIVWFKCEDDGSDRIVSVSIDGQNWQEFHSVGRTDYLTADEVGFMANSVNASWQCALNLLHWKES